MPIHIAITRRVRPGRELEFQHALREFLNASFTHGGVLGASIITPPPGSDSREFGVLRTFANEKERESFYASPLYKQWQERAREFTEGEPVYRRVGEFEAWFRSPGMPAPRWKMALVILLGAYPVSVLNALILMPRLEALPLPLSQLIVTLVMVVLLTWLVMPLLTRILDPWLNPKPEPKTIPH